MAYTTHKCVSLSHKDVELDSPGLVWWLCSIVFSATSRVWPLASCTKMVAGTLAISTRQQGGEEDKDERGQQAQARFIVMEIPKHFQKGTVVYMPLA